MLVIKKSRISWPFNIKVRFCTGVVDPSVQHRSSWCGTLRIMLKISAMHFTASGTESALLMVKFNYKDFIINITLTFT